MESQEQALLWEIIENPDEDGPRLIYADWLEDRGNPRAEFIRIQYELARLDKEARPKGLVRREQVLFEERRSDWLGQLGLPLMWYSFRRGFVEDAMVSADKFIKQKGRILEVSPVRHLRINLVDFGQASAFASVPSLRHLQRLHLSASHETRSLLFPLLESPYLTGLTQLDLIDARFDRDRLDELRRIALGSREDDAIG